MSADAAFWAELLKLGVTNVVALAVLYVLFHLMTHTIPGMFRELTATGTNALQHQTEVYTQASNNQTRLYAELTTSQNALLQAQTRVMTDQMLQQTEAIKSLEASMQRIAELTSGNHRKAAIGE